VSAYVRANRVPIPTLANFQSNTLSLQDMIVTNEMIQTISDFLEVNCHSLECQLERLLANDCHLNDKQFSSILQGIEQQGRNLRSLVYCNNEIGPESTAALLRLLPCLEELQLSRIRASHVLKYQYLRDITEVLLEFGGELKVLKLSRISLNDAAVAENMCQFL